MVGSARAQQAANKVSVAHGWGPCTAMGVSSAAVFKAGPALLRVVDDNADPAGTLHVARLVADRIGGAAPLLPDPAEVPDEAGGVVRVEVYELLDSDPHLTPDFRQLGRSLAQLHSVDICGADVRVQRRSTVSRLRLARADAAVRSVLEPQFDAAEAALVASVGPMVLCHGDPTRANLVNTNGSWVWVDFEYAGTAPASFDVGMCAVSLIRFCGREAAREMVAGYQQAGGTFDPADAILLGGLRDLCGAADFAAATADSGRQTFALRFGSFGELFRQTRW